MSKILILGATSAIAQAYARRRAAQGCDFILAARREDRLAAIAADLMACGAASAETFVADLAAIERIEESAARLPGALRRDPTRSSSPMACSASRRRPSRISRRRAR